MKRLIIFIGSMFLTLIVSCSKIETIETTTRELSTTTKEITTTEIIESTTTITNLSTTTEYSVYEITTSNPKIEYQGEVRYLTLDIKIKNNSEETIILKIRLVEDFVGYPMKYKSENSFGETLESHREINCTLKFEIYELIESGNLELQIFDDPRENIYISFENMIYSQNFYLNEDDEILKE